MQLSEARRPLREQFQAEPTEVFSKAGNEVSHHSSTSTLPVHSAVHEVSTVVTCRGSAGIPEAACDVDRPPAPGGAGSPDAASGVGGVGTEEFDAKCKGAYPVSPNDQILMNDEQLADASGAADVGKETDKMERRSKSEDLHAEDDEEFWDNLAEETFGPDDSRRRREGSLPYSRSNKGRLLKYKVPVDDGGYMDGVLVDKEYEEEFHGSFTKEALEEEEELAKRLAVEPRRRRPSAPMPVPEVQPEDSQDKEVEPKRLMRDPGQPTKQEIEEHNVDHTRIAAGVPVA